MPEEPLSSGDEADRTDDAASKPPQRPRTTSSWVRWWGGKSQVNEDVEKGRERELDPRSTASSPRMVQLTSFLEPRLLCGILTRALVLQLIANHGLASSAGWKIDRLGTTTRSP
jgi:hypothetical protein